MHGISVGKKQPGATRMSRTGGERVRLAGAARAQGSGVHNLDIRKRRGDFASAVGGIVVHHDDLEINCILSHDGLQAGSQAVFLITRGDNYGNLGSIASLLSRLSL